MDAIITAGGKSTPDDPLYAVTNIEKKALIPLAGQPMIAWVAQALWDSGLVENIVIVGLEPSEITLEGLPTHFTPAVGGMIDNLLAGFAKLEAVNPTADKVLLCSSDIPLVTPDSIKGFVAECGNQTADVYYAVVEERVMEARFPGSNRTFVPFKGGRYSGGDVFLTHIKVPSKIDFDLFHNLTGSRKNYFKQARLLGFGFIIRFLFRQMAVADAAARASEVINLEARGVETRYAELGMDLDKPHQYDMIKAELEKGGDQSS